MPYSTKILAKHSARAIRTTLHPHYIPQYEYEKLYKLTGIRNGFSAIANLYDNGVIIELSSKTRLNSNLKKEFPILFEIIEALPYKDDVQIYYLDLCEISEDLLEMKKFNWD